MAERLAEDVPSDLEDVDTEFDDESNRWFAREFYAVKHECNLIKKMRDVGRQRVGVVKLHRTALRLVQVAASRPILRVLNPHIYGQLGDLVRDLVDLSDALELPLWDPEPILDALERAVYFPPRRSHSRRASIGIERTRVYSRTDLNLISHLVASHFFIYVRESDNSILK